MAKLATNLDCVFGEHENVGFGCCASKHCFWCEKTNVEWTFWSAENFMSQVTKMSEGQIRAQEKNCIQSPEISTRQTKCNTQ